MRTMTKLFSMLLVVFCSIDVVWGQDEQAFDEPLEQYLRLLEAGLSNAMAIESGDVLWKESYFFDSTDFAGLNRPEDYDPDKLQPGKVMEVQSWHRLIFDHQEKRVCYLRKTVQTQQDFSNDSIKPVQKVSWYGIVDDQKNDRAFITTQPGFAQESFSSKHNGNLVKSFSFPDLRKVNDRQKSIERLKEQSPAIQIRRLENSYVVQIEFKPYSGDAMVDHEIEAVISIPFVQRVFDADSLLVVETKNWSEKPRGVKFRGGSLNTQYKEIRGVYVPISVSDSDKTRLIIFGEPTFGHVEIRKHFHWFSLNEGVDRMNVFQGEAFESLEAFEKMIDPVKSNASSLIMTSPTETQSKSDDLSRPKK